MNFLAQVRHVVAKDVKESRWLLAVYALIVVAVTVHVAGWLSDTGITGSLWMVLVILVGMFTAASVLQADPPLQSNAFWASRPLASSAVLAAKVVIAVGIVALGAAGQFVALAAYDLQLREAAVKAGGSAILFGVLLLVALVFAAVTRDLRGFTLALLAVPVLGSVTSLLGRAELSPAVVQLVDVGRPVIGAIAGLLLLAWLYRTRDVKMTQRVVTAVAVTILLVGAPPLTSAEPPGPPAPRDGTLPFGSVQLLPMDERSFQRGEVPLTLDVHLRSEAYDLQLTGKRVTIHLRDTSLVVDSGRERVTALVSSGLPVLAGIRWQRPDASPRTRVGLGASVSLSASQRVLRARGVDSVTLEGTLVAYEARVAATIPLRARAPIARRGRRFYIEELAHDGRHAQIDLRTASVLDSAARIDMAFGAEYALLNGTRGEAIALRESGSRGSGGGLVLPGTTLWVNRGSLGTAGHFDRPTDPTIDAAWLTGAELMVIERVPRERHRIRVTSGVVGRRD